MKKTALVGVLALMLGAACPTVWAQDEDGSMEEHAVLKAFDRVITLRQAYPNPETISRHLS